MAPPDRPAPGADAYPSPAAQAAALHAFLAVKNPRLSPKLSEDAIAALAPKQLEPVKTLARRLRPVMARLGVRMKHPPALEAAARIQGQSNWHETPTELHEPPRTCGAVLGSPFPRARGNCAVEKPEVVEVLDRLTGLFERHCDVIGDDWAAALQLRLEVQTSLDVNARFLCAQCFTPVYLVSRHDAKKLFFRHTLEDGRCAAVTRGELSQDEINARKYNGVKESWLHIEMKRWIVDCLLADGRFTDIAVEERWTGEVTGAWRKPDVRAVFNGIPIALEVQLSTTYLNVIAQRREFYRQEGGLLFWVFSQFSMDARRLTQDDVFYNNNRNAFVLTSETRDRSVRQKRFMLECVWAEPAADGYVDTLQRETVPFDSLTLDPATQRAYYFDFDGQRSSLIQQAWRDSQRRRAALRERFDTFYLTYMPERSFDARVWQVLYRDITAEGLYIPHHPGSLPTTLLNALYSAKYGRVFGWTFPNFIQAAHQMVPGNRGHLHYFRRALLAYNRADLVRSEDHTRKWAAKVIEYKAAIRAGDPTYAPDTEYDDLVELLFPEVMAVTL